MSVFIFEAKPFHQKGFWHQDDFSLQESV